VVVVAGTQGDAGILPPGRPVLGGGVRAGGAGDESHVVGSRPLDTRDRGTLPEDGWRGAVTNMSDRDLGLTVHAICR
jgi:hypothetical protein